MFTKSLVILSALLLFAARVEAAPDKYNFDKDHTHIFFNVNHLGFSEMYGRIKQFDGYFTFDEKNPEKSTLDVTLSPASVDTDVPELNKVLQGDKFLNTAKFPTIHFKSTKIELLRNGVIGGVLEDSDAVRRTGYITGDLTLLGVTQPVKLTVLYNKSGVHKYTNNYTAGFSADATIKRSDFGMKAYLPDVGDEIHIHIEAEGVDPLKHSGNSKTPH
jgi:polyisoprenoid-binding protein YceI